MGRGTFGMTEYERIRQQAERRTGKQLAASRKRLHDKQEALRRIRVRKSADLDEKPAF